MGTVDDVLAPGRAIGAAATLGTLHILDRFVIERFARGWRPSSFVDEELWPFVNCWPIDEPRGLARPALAVSGCQFPKSPVLLFEVPCVVGTSSVR